MFIKSKLNKIPRFFSSLALAKEVIDNSLYNQPLQDKDKFKIAKAHFSLFQSPKITKLQALVHLNSCISILQSITKQTHLLKKLLAIAHFKRGEIFELQEQYKAAILDYKKSISITSKFKYLSDNEIMLFAESCLSIANILIFQASNENIPIPDDSFRFSDYAVKYILKSNFTKPSIFSCLAFAFQTLGIAVSDKNAEESLQYFNLSLRIIYKIKDLNINKFIAQVFNFLKNIYIIKMSDAQFFPQPINYEYNAIIYDFFYESLLNLNEKFIDTEFLEDIITKITNPREFHIPLETIINITDVMIFMFQYLDYNFVLNLHNNLNKNHYEQLQNNLHIHSHKNLHKGLHEDLHNKFDLKDKHLCKTPLKDNTQFKLKDIDMLIKYILKLTAHCFYLRNHNALIISYLKNDKFNLYNDVIQYYNKSTCRIFKFKS